MQSYTIQVRDCHCLLLDEKSALFLFFGSPLWCIKNICFRWFLEEQASKRESLKETTEKYTDKWHLWFIWTKFWHGNAFGGCWFIGMLICLLWDKCWLSLNSFVDYSCMLRSNHVIGVTCVPLDHYFILRIFFQKFNMSFKK